MAGEIIVRDNGITVEQAPDDALVSLQLIAHATRGLQVVGDTIVLGERPGNVVTYKVTGWDDRHAALVVEKVS